MKTALDRIDLERYFAAIMPLFTRENAREMSIRGNDARWHKPLAPAIIPPSDSVAGNVAENWNRTQRDEVRARMKRYEAMMDKETDASALDRLTSAWSRLAEQERILDGRPLPGSRRPAVEKPAKLSFSGPLDHGQDL